MREGGREDGKKGEIGSENCLAIPRAESRRRYTNKWFQARQVQIQELPNGSHLVVVGGLACPRYLESYTRGDFNPCSPPLWGKRVSHASKVCQGRARLNVSHELAASTGQQCRPPEGPPSMGRPVLDNWVSGPEGVGKGISAPSWANFRIHGGWGCFLNGAVPWGTMYPAHGGQRSVPSSVR